MTKKIILFCLVILLSGTGFHNAKADRDVNEDSIGDVIKYVRDEYNEDKSPENRRRIAERVTEIVDNRLINSNSSEWFTRPVYAWLGVTWVRNDPSYGDEYYNQANVSWSKGYGNCGENSIVTYYILKKAGVQEHVRYIQAGKNRSHSFTAWGMPPDAIIQDPGTWGDALIVDPWVGEVLTADEIKDHIWFQNGNPETPLRDSTAAVDEDAEDWNTIWREEMKRTGRTGKGNGQVGYSENPNVNELYEDCFIATAVYGTPLNDEIQALRNYRDSVLREKMLGRAFIKTYEKLGPIAAFYIKQKDSRREWTRKYIVEPALEFIKYE